MLILGKNANSAGDDFRIIAGLVELCRKRTKSIEPALADDPICFFGHNAEMSADPAVVSGKRTVGKSVVRLFAIAASLQEQKQAFIPGCLAGLEDSVDERA